MSYSFSPALQTAIYTALIEDETLVSLVDGAIFDMAPDGSTPDRFVAIGPEKVVEKSDVSGRGAEHEVEVYVVTESDGFYTIKEIAARISTVLDGADLTLSTGYLSALQFLRAEALRNTSDDTRRVRLWFRARVDENLPV